MANIQKRGDRSWLLTVSLGRGSDGKYIRKTKTIYIDDDALLKTTKKLDTYLNNEYAKFKQEVESGMYISPNKMTLKDFVEEWKIKYADNKLSDKTKIMYYSNLDKKVIPVLGHMRIDKINTMHILDFFENLNADKRLSSATVITYHRALMNVFNRAVEWGIINSNPVNAYSPPPPKHKSITPYSEEEVKQLLLALEDEPYHWRMFIILAIFTGVRRGELIGLEWDCVDLEAGTIKIRQSLGISTEGKTILKEPKTNKSKRIVALPSIVLEELKNYKLHCEQERELVKDLLVDTEHDFVFSHYDGTAFHHDRPSSWFNGFLNRKGLRFIRLHDLRHTSATLLINQGVHPKLISSRLGHSNINTTMNIYGHALQSADHVAANKLNDIFNSTEG